MKIVHVEPSAKRKIRSLPVTGNYLVKEGNGMLRWAEPNDSWRLYAPTGGQRCLITNIRYDDTEHSPDLWLYSVLKKDEMHPGVEDDLISKSPRPISGIADDLFEDNRIHLNRSRKWYIRQFVENKERIGVKRFTGLPLDAFWAMWRKVVPLSEIEIYGLSNQQMKILYGGMTFNTFVKWTELQADMFASDTFMTQKGVNWKISKKIMPWLHANCQGGIIPFSDYDLMFPDDQDEITYTIDVA